MAFKVEQDFVAFFGLVPLEVRPIGRRSRSFAKRIIPAHLRRFTAILVEGFRKAFRKVFDRNHHPAARHDLAKVHEDDQEVSGVCAAVDPTKETQPFQPVPPFDLVQLELQLRHTSAHQSQSQFKNMIHNTTFALTSDTSIDLYSFFGRNKTILDRVLMNESPPLPRTLQRPLLANAVLQFYIFLKYCGE